jgi:hypothetical protein
VNAAAKTGSAFTVGDAPTPAGSFAGGSRRHALESLTELARILRYDNMSGTVLHRLRND